ncbi:hypothetical protein CRG98_028706 [Punica granatum]|uniref:Uncharacterized protein n=1 Tax=Punica granatum TaxID=22663 RepID=A0A2I0J3V0_PUNGR|nr:hypothetical protein CRG98_028706 [Punica granatum]
MGGKRYQSCRQAQKGGAYYGLWLHPLTGHATKEGQAVNTPFWPTGFLHENPRSKPGGSQRLSVNLRGTFTENRDCNDSRTPRDIQRALRKPRSQVPRPSRANGLWPEVTSQRSPNGQKGPPKRTLRRSKSNRGPRTLNSTPNVRTGQNRLSRRRVARTSVHTT